MKLYRQKSAEQGQTLVETMVAIFIMVMGITAALGLAIYSFNATSLVNKQIVAMGLAREGIESVKNMRDTNWLQSPQFDAGCNCYTDWQESYYNINTNGNGTYTLDFNPFAEPYWLLTPESKNFRLSYDSTASSGRFYFPSYSSLGGESGSDRYSDSDYYRRITLTEDADSPYNSTSPRLQVTADVWWKDKKCPDATYYEDSKPSCRVRLVTYLTNWKNY
jgi:type II secretory pathway pseudopilin PulG